MVVTLEQVAQNMFSEMFHVWERNDTVKRYCFRGTQM